MPSSRDQRRSPLSRPPDQQIEELVAAAAEVRTNAYAPYSEFHVGAAILAGGRVFTGVNVENASYPVSVCAERNAVAAAIAAGERRIDCIAVVTDADRPTPPCGGCRQVLWEFGPESLVVSETTGGGRAAWALEDLIPEAFGPNSFGPDPHR
jgi:cytidine deaminase